MALTREEQKFILRIARASIEAELGVPQRETTKGETQSITEALRVCSGVFVTLHKAGALRGCIGNFISNLPLYKNIAEMARSSAFSDPRFNPLQADELRAIDIEISVLSPLREIKDVNEIEVGRHGIFIEKGYARGVLLPQVATENNFDCETFLEHTCMKAGLEPQCWKSGATISIFEVEIFGERD